MPTTQNTKNKTRIALIGKFTKLYDEEYIARSFESLGHEVLRADERLLTHQIIGLIDEFNPDVVIWTKLMVIEPKKLREALRKYKTVCWVFDLYFDYEREFRLKTHPAFTADYVFTTDGGHQDRFKALGINHICVRQGIFKDECFMVEPQPEDSIVFVGSENVYNQSRNKQISIVSQRFGDIFKWYGRFNTNEVRGTELNDLYAKTKIVIGDSVYSPHYWSNRIVETLGRGGFLIHQEVEGLQETYPHLVTYRRGDFEDLCGKINYYLTHEDERLEIVRKNYEWVRDNYTCDKQCQKILAYIS